MFRMKNRHPASVAVSSKLQPLLLKEVTVSFFLCSLQIIDTRVFILAVNKQWDWHLTGTFYHVECMIESSKYNKLMLVSIQPQNHKHKTR
ncbi:hypothetical protein Hdeb2414_s0028g00703431 [Helianthus debilis subsp. tardiflorus]